MINLIKDEYIHFKSLSQKAQRLIISYFFMSLSYPILGTFINAFIFKNIGSIYIFIIYFFGQFIGLTLAFFLNGLLLRKFNIKNIYFFGTLLLGVTTLMIVFFSQNSLQIFFIYGIIFGIGGGLHWGNRNFLTLNETHSKNRNYFMGLNFSLDTITSVTVSFLVGWLIVLGLNYQILMISVFVFLFISGYVILKSKYNSPNVLRIEIKSPSKKWWNIRILHMGLGSGEGILFFISSFLILSRIGNEGILGTLSAMSSLFGAFLIYFYGRKSSSKHQFPTFIFSLIAVIITSAVFAVFFNSLSTIIYVISSGLALNFMWLVAGPLIMNQIDKETNKIEGEKYAYIFDGEVFLNIGRCFSLTLSLAIIYMFGQDFFLRYSPLMFYLVQALSVISAKNVFDNKKMFQTMV